MLKLQTKKGVKRLYLHNLYHTMFFGFIHGCRYVNPDYVTLDLAAENFCEQISCPLSPETLARHYYETQMIQVALNKSDGED